NDEKVKLVSQTSGLVGPGVNEPLKKVQEERKHSETDVHQDAFKAQQDIQTWPRPIEDRFDFAHGWFATEITVLPAPKDKDSYPDNDDGLIHGIITHVDVDSLTVNGVQKVKENDKEIANDKIAECPRTAQVKFSRQEKKQRDRETWCPIGIGNCLGITC